MDYHRARWTTAIKILSTLLLVASAVAIVGAGLSAVGYYQSSQLISVTTTQYLTTTSTIISAGTFATSSEAPKFSDFQITVSGTSGTNYGCGTGSVDITYSNGKPIVIDAGQIHVTFSTQPSSVVVDFWVLTPSQYEAWSKVSYCSDMEQASAIYFGRSVSSYDDLIPIPETGSYYFAFANFGQEAASVTITVAQVTQTQAITFSTEMTVFPTENVTSVSQPVGLGPQFYVGLVAAIAGAALLALGRLSHSHDDAEPPVEEIPMQPGVCENCRASLVHNARFCKECGTPVGQTQA